MFENPKFSIIIPVYNIEKYLEKCVTSILDQANNNFEIILVDDGSNDRSPQICDSFSDSNNIVKSIHTINKGVSFARFIGLSKAVGEYIMFVDGDDFISKNCLERVENEIDKNNPDILVFKAMYGNTKTYKPYKMDYASGMYSRERIKNEIFPSLIQSESGNYFPPSIWGKIFKKELIESNMLVSSNAVMGEDGACTISSIFHANTMEILDEYYYYYRLNENSATKKRNPLTWEWSKIVCQHLTTHIDLNESDFKDQINRKMVHDLFQIVRSQYYSKQPKKCIDNDIKKHLNDPIYDEAISNCKFATFSVINVVSVLLKRRILFPFYIYAKITK